MWKGRIFTGIKKIENDSKCKPICCIGHIETTGNTANSTTCFCINQMRNVIQQIITLYPNDNFIITMKRGNNASGRARTLLPAPNPVSPGCDSNCENAIRSYLPAGTPNVDINARVK